MIRSEWRGQGGNFKNHRFKKFLKFQNSPTHPTPSNRNPSFHRLVTVYANASSITSSPYTVLNSGLITFGGEDDVNCAAGTYTYYPLGSVVCPYPFYMRFGLNVSSFNTSNGVTSGSISHPAWLYTGVPGMGYVSQQVFDVFVNASGGLNYTKTGYYSGEHDTGDCATVLGSAQDVWLNLAGGGSIVFTPYDYLEQVGLGSGGG